MIDELQTGSYDDGDDLTYDYIVDKIALKLKFNVIEELGNGGYGKAYLIDGGRVVKITTSKNEAEVSNKLIGKDYEHVSTVYSVHRLKYKGIHKDNSLYCIVLQYLPPLPFVLTKAIRTPIFDAVYNGTSRNRLIELTDGSASQKIFVGLYDMVKQLRSLGIDADVHAGNVGMKGDKYAAYDVMIDSGREVSNNVSKTLKIR